jgi:hypothetical protein
VGLLHHPITGINAGSEHHSSLQSEVIITQSFPEATGCLIPNPSEQTTFMAEEAKGTADVETENGHLHWCQMTGCSKNGAISAEHNGKIWQMGFSGKKTWEGIPRQTAFCNCHGYPGGGKFSDTTVCLTTGDLTVLSNNQPNPFKAHQRWLTSGEG